MRKIDKTTILSTEYKRWEEGFEYRQEDHPPYKADRAYYIDVVMNLLHCQEGRCAYTEMRLCAEADYKPEHWKNGRYASKRPDFFGELEHYDHNLKEHKGWLWSNFFMVHSDINRKVKKTYDVDPILKPDSDDYDPFELLAYDEQTHRFIANTDLPDSEQQRINQMIMILGINYGSVIAHRREILSEQFAKIEFCMTTWDEQPKEFITSFEMCKRERHV